MRSIGTRLVLESLESDWISGWLPLSETRAREKEVRTGNECKKRRDKEGKQEKESSKGGAA